MAKDPAVLFFTSDFLSGTSFFTMEERGQYITLLCEQHQLYSIPEEHLLKICGSLNSSVAKKFIKDSDGTYYQHRMREETIKRRAFCESRRKSIEQRYIRSTHVAHTKVRMEDENGNRNEDINTHDHKEGMQGEKTWHTDFETYKIECDAAFIKCASDWEWIAEKKRYHPYTNIRRSLEKMFNEYWGTQAGWKKKKSCRKITTIDWLRTIDNGLSMEINRVRIPKGMPDIEQEEIEKRKHAL
jgi:hypothetical protein